MLSLTGEQSMHFPPHLSDDAIKSIIINRYNMIRQFLILSAICLTLGSALQCTKPQRMGWFSFDALSARDHVTEVFEDLNKNMTSADPYTTTVNGTQYTMSDFLGQAYYNDIFQKDVYVNDTVVNVTGGHLTIAVQFNYSFNGTSGTAHGNAVADDFWFTKRLERPEGYITWDLMTAKEIEMKNNIVITSSSPKLPDIAKSAYQNMINNHAQEQNRLKQNLLSQLNRLYHTQLAFSLHNEDLVKINNVTYTYNKIVAAYTNAVFDVKLNNVGFKGLQYSFLFELDNYTKECNDLPTQYNASFGGVQEIFAFGWVKATFNYFVDKGLLDVKLDNKWDIEMFQFYLGDIGNVIPEAQKFKPSTPVTGTCEVNKAEEIVIAAETNNSIRAQIPYTLKLYVNDTTLLQTVTFTAVFLQKWSLSGSYLVTSITYTGVAGVVFKPAGNFEVTNVALATQYMRRVLESFQGKESLGQKFEVVHRKKGGVVIEKDYIIMYDPSQS